MPKILVVDDDAIFRKVLSNLLISRGYKVALAEHGEEALEVLRANNGSFDLMISDVSMGPMDGMELLQRARALFPDLGVVMLTGHATVDMAVEAMKMGAFDYVVKPFRTDELFQTVQRVLEYYHATPGYLPCKAQPQDGLIACSAGMRAACKQAERVAPADVAVLICGEEGVGKELVAHTIHRHSPRKDSPFLILNCSGRSGELLESELFGRAKDVTDKASRASAGLFESAKGGTVFLREIGELPLDLQRRLFEAIRDKKITQAGSAVKIRVDARVLVDSSKELGPLVEQGVFDKELYNHLLALQINIPPLRSRPEDILPLANMILCQENNVQQAAGSEAPAPMLDSEVKEILYNYSWPGNALELIDALHHAHRLMQNGVITKQSLPEKIIQSVETDLNSKKITVRREQLKGASFKSLLLKTKASLIRPPDEETPPPPPLTSQEDDNDYWL